MPPNPSARLITEAGELLYGRDWKSPLARDLDLSDTRRIYDWISNPPRRPVPAGIMPDILKLLEKRRHEIDAFLEKSKKAVDMRT